MSQYTILYADGDELHEVLVSLQDKVSHAISNGWELQGGISLSVKALSVNSYTNQFFNHAAQAMVRNESAPIT